MFISTVSREGLISVCPLAVCLGPSSSFLRAFQFVSLGVVVHPSGVAIRFGVTGHFQGTKICSRAVVS